MVLSLPYVVLALKPYVTRSYGLEAWNKVACTLPSCTGFTGRETSDPLGVWHALPPTRPDQHWFYLGPWLIGSGRDRDVLDISIFSCYLNLRRKYRWTKGPSS